MIDDECFGQAGAGQIANIEVVGTPASAPVLKITAVPATASTAPARPSALNRSWRWASASPNVNNGMHASRICEMLPPGPVNEPEPGPNWSAEHDRRDQPASSRRPSRSATQITAKITAATRNASQRPRTGRGSQPYTRRSGSPARCPRRPRTSSANATSVAESGCPPGSARSEGSGEGGFEPSRQGYSPPNALAGRRLSATRPLLRGRARISHGAVDSSSRRTLSAARRQSWTRAINSLRLSTLTSMPPRRTS